MGLLSLADFKAKGCGPGFFYAWLWFSLVLSISVYAVDSFTAVNLLVFNRWSSRIEPAIPLNVSRWIFSGCIMASFVNLAYEGVRAIRVMRRSNVAECYMDSLAARWESIRLGSGQGWRRFLVFAELTKSKKGSEYVAVFTYFSFQTWIRVILCSGPRQIVNAFTLRSVYEAKLNPTSNSVEGSIRGFMDKIRALAMEDYQQAVILSGMCFTLIVWVFSALFLLAAVFSYVLFLFHWIPRVDGSLVGYCTRKVNKRLTRIVTTKVCKALAKGQAKRDRADAFAAQFGDKVAGLERTGTLPTIPDMAAAKEVDGYSEIAALSRTGTTATLPLYSSRPGTPTGTELDAVFPGGPIPPGPTPQARRRAFPRGRRWWRAQPTWVATRRRRSTADTWTLTWTPWRRKDPTLRARKGALHRGQDTGVRCRRQGHETTLVRRAAPDRALRRGRSRGAMARRPRRGRTRHTARAAGRARRPWPPRGGRAIPRLGRRRRGQGKRRFAA